MGGCGDSRGGFGWKVSGFDMGDLGRVDWGLGEGRGGRVLFWIGVV